MQYGGKICAVNANENDLQLGIANALQLDRYETRFTWTEIAIAHFQMTRSQNPSSAMSRYEELQKALKKSGLKLTRQRKAVLNALAKSDDHPDANELHRRTQAIDESVSLATVYRTMTELENNGVIHRLSFQGEPARFEAADTPHHDHIIDVDTGDVIEFQSEKIERLQAEIARELGYEVVHHRLELYCRKTNKQV